MSDTHSHTHTHKQKREKKKKEKLHEPHFLCKCLHVWQEIMDSVVAMNINEMVS